MAGKSITWTNAKLSNTGSSGTNASKRWIQDKHFLWRNCNWKYCLQNRPLCSDRNMFRVPLVSVSSTVLSNLCWCAQYWCLTGVCVNILRMGSSTKLPHTIVKPCMPHTIVKPCMLGLRLCVSKIGSLANAFGFLYIIAFNSPVSKLFAPSGEQPEQHILAYKQNNQFSVV